MELRMTVQAAYLLARCRWGSGAYAFELTENGTGRVACHVGFNSNIFQVVEIDVAGKSVTVEQTDKIDPNGLTMTMGSGETFEEAFESADRLERAIS